MSSLFNNTKTGYCRICGEYCSFTKDHFPPAKCFNEKPIYVDQPYNKRIEKGLKVRTICQKCNSRLGGDYDHVLKTFTHQIHLLYPLYIKKKNFKKISVILDKSKLLRGLLGHLLACYDRQVDLKRQPELERDCYVNRMRKYVLGEDNQFNNEIRVLFWIHNYKSIQILSNLSMMTMDRLILGGAIFSFYPVGFLILNSYEKAVVDNLHLNELIIDGKDEIIIDFSCVKDEDFPFSLLKKNESLFFLYNHHHLIHGIRPEVFAND